MARKRESSARGGRGRRRASRSSGVRPARHPAWRRFTARVPFGLLAVVLAAGFFVWHANEFRFTQDDAYISLRYARNLVEGEGLVFNPGERVEGYSNFTWTLLLAAFLRLGAPAVAAATWLGVLFGTATVFAAARLARALEGRWGPVSITTATLVAGNSALALWSTGGLETALFTFLVTAGLERGLAPGVSARGRTAAPILLLLAALTRPDGPILFGLWFAIRLFDTFVRPGPAAATGGPRELVRDALLFAGPLVPYGAWKLAYYGDLLPNTYYAKAGLSATYVSRGLVYAKDFFLAYGVGGLAPLAGLAAVVRHGRGSIEARLLLIWLGFAAYVVGIGGDVLYVHRFWLPVFPIGAVLAARGLEATLGRIASGPVAVVLPFVGGLILTGVPLWRQWEPIQDRREREVNFVLNMRQTGEWLGAHLSPDSKVAITTIGAIAYYSRLHVIDMLGLTDPEIARTPVLIDGLKDTWREVKYNAPSVLRRRPDAILFSTGVRPSSAAEKALFLYKGFLESYRPYYFRSLPSRQNIQVMFRAEPGGGPVNLDRIGVTDLEFLDLYGDAHLLLGKQADRDQAIEMFRQSMVIAGDEFPWAEEWWAVGRYDAGDSTAVPRLRELAAKTPTPLAVLTRVADHALRSGQLEEADSLFAHLTEVDPDDSVGWIGRAEVARKRGNYEAALAFAKEGVVRWDSLPSNLVLLGSLALRFGEYELASSCYQRALALEPGHETATRGLAYLEGLRTGRIRLPDAPSPGSPAPGPPAPLPAPVPTGPGGGGSGGS